MQLRPDGNLLDRTFVAFLVGACGTAAANLLAVLSFPHLQFTTIALLTPTVLALLYMGLTLASSVQQRSARDTSADAARDTAAAPPPPPSDATASDNRDVTASPSEADTPPPSARDLVETGQASDVSTRQQPHSEKTDGTSPAASTAASPESPSDDAADAPGLDAPKPTVVADAPNLQGDDGPSLATSKPTIQQPADPEPLSETDATPSADGGSTGGEGLIEDTRETPPARFDTPDATPSGLVDEDTRDADAPSYNVLQDLSAKSDTPDNEDSNQDGSS